jgi:DNA-binding transcriptional ArsR family regulator
MAVTSRKSSKEEIGKHPEARPKAVSIPNGGDRRERQAQRASILLKTIGDPTRLEVILILAKGEQHIGSLCVRLGQSQPAVSHHLALLRHARVIAARQTGSKNVYRLTDAGYALAHVARTLSGNSATGTPAARRRPRPARSLPIKSDRPSGDGTPSGSPNTPDVQSSARFGINEEQWSRMNRRRAELIFKKNRGGLNVADRSELKRLQALSLSRMQSKFPGPTLIDEKLKSVEKRLCSDGLETE